MSRAGPNSADARANRLDATHVLVGAALFVGLGVLGAWAVSRLDPTGAVSVAGVLSSVPPTAVAAVVALVVADWLMGGTRLHLWVRHVEPGTPFHASFRSYLVNLFAAAVSPMGTASGPAQVAVMARYGVRPMRGFTVLLLNYVGVMAAFMLVGGASGAYLAATSERGGPVGAIFRSLAAVVSVGTVLLVAVLANPHLGDRLARRLRRTGRRRGGRAGRLLRRAGLALARGVGDYRAALASLGGGGWKGPAVGSLGLSIVMLLNKGTMGYVLATSIGYEGGWVDVAARQALQWILIYFSPTPGGGGIAEATVPAFLAGIVPVGRVLEFTVLWRLLTAFLGAGAGAVAAVGVLRPTRR